MQNILRQMFQRAKKKCLTECSYIKSFSRNQVPEWVVQHLSIIYIYIYVIYTTYDDSRLQSNFFVAKGHGKSSVGQFSVELLLFLLWIGGGPESNSRLSLMNHVGSYRIMLEQCWIILDHIGSCWFIILWVPMNSMILVIQYSSLQWLVWAVAPSVSQGSGHTSQNHLKTKRWFATG